MCKRKRKENDIGERGRGKQTELSLWKSCGPYKGLILFCSTKINAGVLTLNVDWSQPCLLQLDVVRQTPGVPVVQLLKGRQDPQLNVQRVTSWQPTGRTCSTIAGLQVALSTVQDEQLVTRLVQEDLGEGHAAVLYEGLGGWWHLVEVVQWTMLTSVCNGSHRELL